MKSICMTSDEISLILNGEKTQCRKIIKEQPKYYISTMEINSDWHNGKKFDDWNYVRVFYKCYSPYKVGETIYCKEPWGRTSMLDVKDGEWRNVYNFAITMPEWASRCKIRITDIKCERLQDISEEDAVKEGFEPEAVEGDEMFTSPIYDFFDNFYDKNHKYIKNKTNPLPWVWVYTFELANGVTI